MGIGMSRNGGPMGRDDCEIAACTMTPAACAAATVDWAARSTLSTVPVVSTASTSILSWSMNSALDTATSNGADRLIWVSLGATGAASVDVMPSVQP